MIWKEGVLKDFAKFTGKHLCQSFSFNEVAIWGLQLYQKRDHRCFTANFPKFLRTLFFLEQLRWLLLSVVTLNSSMYREYRWIHFHRIFPLHISWKHRKSFGFPVFSGCIKWEHLARRGLKECGSALALRLKTWVIERLKSCLSFTWSQHY